MPRWNSIYMKVTDDKYELPIGVSESAKELSDKTGVKVNTINANIFYGRGRYVRLDAGGEE